MKIELKIKDVLEMTEEKRHIFLVDNEEFKRCIMQHQEFVKQEIIREIIAHDAKLMSEILDNKDIRNTIYMQEKAKREKKAVERVKIKQAQIDKQRRREAFMSSVNYRKSVDYIHNVLGWNND